MQTLGLSLFLLTLAGCADLTSPAPPPGESQEFTSRVGTQWTYIVKRKGEAQGTITWRVTQIENGITYLSADFRNAGEKSPSSMNELRWIEDGGLHFSNFPAGTPPAGKGAQMVYKMGSKKGDRWPNYLGDTTAEHQGKVEVHVPAGTYKDAIHIKVLSDADGRLVYEYWLVPRIGWWVKLTLQPTEFELEKFEEPSK